MLHILLLILKIIGIIILVLLGLLLLAACCILFVPVRYRAHAHYDETAGAHAKLSWLLRLVYLKADFAPETQGFHLVLKICGITFFDNQKPKKKKPERKAAEKKSQATPTSEQWAVEQDKPALPEPKPPAAEQEKVPPDRIETHEDEHTIDESVQPPDEEPEAVSDSSAPERDAASENEKASGIGDKLRQFFNKIKEKLLGIVHRIQGMAASVKRFFSHMADTKDGLRSRLDSVLDKKNAVWAIFTDEKNRTAFLKVKKLVFRILRHLRPTKLDIRLEFGFDDPASTGHTLGLLSLLYPVYTDHIRLYPDFENKVFKGECTARGRLRASVFLFVVCQLIFDKDVRRILKSFKNI